MIGSDLPALAIRRPLLVLVLNLLIALAGLAAFLGVEVRELPDIERPVVSVRGDFPGVSPETVDVEVTALVEGAGTRVAGVKEERSSSEENNFRMRVVFSHDVDLDAAASDVREAVSRVERQLPEAVEQLTVIKADADATPVMRLGWVVFGGHGLAALFTLYLTPVVYLALARFAKPRAAEGARLERELRDAASVSNRTGARPAR